MAAIIAQITRANRERKRKKTYEIQERIEKSIVFTTAREVITNINL